MTQDYARRGSGTKRQRTRATCPPFNLGALYDNGLGVEQDYAKAREWYEKAADKGNAYAQFKIGRAHENGLGVTQDYAKAMAWYQKAADQGHAAAKARLEQMPIR